MAAYTARPDTNRPSGSGMATRRARQGYKGRAATSGPCFHGWLRGLARQGQVEQGAAVAWIGKAGFGSVAARRGSDRLVGAWRGCVRRGVASTGVRLGSVWRRGVRQGDARRGSHRGTARRGGVGQCTARHGLTMAWQRVARNGQAGQGGHRGQVGLCIARHGEASTKVWRWHGQSRWGKLPGGATRGGARLGYAWPGGHSGLAGIGIDWLGQASRGEARHAPRRGKARQRAVSQGVAWRVDLYTSSGRIPVGAASSLALTRHERKAVVSNRKRAAAANRDGSHRHARDR